MIRQVELRGSEIGNYIATLTADDIIQDNYYKTLESINKIKEKNEDVRYIIICDYSGQVILHTFNNDFPLGLDPNIESSKVKNYSVNHYNSNEGSIYEINTPIENGNIGGAVGAFFHFALAIAGHEEQGAQLHFGFPSIRPARLQMQTSSLF